MTLPVRITWMVWLATRALGVVLLGRPLVLFPWQADVRGDLLLYAHYAHQWQSGLMPYRDFALEYPPGVLPLLALPAGNDAAYLVAFLAVALIADAVIQYALRSREIGSWIWLLAPVALGSVFWARLDIFVAVTAVAFVLSADAQRWGRAGAALASMGLLKLWPLALLLVLLPIVPPRGRRRFLAAATGVLLLGTLPILALGGGDGLHLMTSFHSERGVEIEAVAAIPLLISRLVDVGPHVQSLFGCLQFPLSGWGQTIATCALVAGLVVTMLWVRRLGTSLPMSGCLLMATLTTVVTSKVLSPQYMVWVAVVVALAVDRHPTPRRLTVVLAAALVTTQALFPYAFIGLALVEPAAVALAVLHGIAILMLAVTGVRPMLTSQPSSSNSPRRSVLSGRAHVRTAAGFTLVELLITIVVLGILAAIVTLAVGGITDRGVHASCTTQRKTVETAAATYLIRQPQLPGATSEDRLQTLVDAGLLRTLPGNGAGYTITVSADGKAGPAECPD